MDVTLPNGKVIRGVPEGTSRDEIASKAVSSGLATWSDFPEGVGNKFHQNSDVPTDEALSVPAPNEGKPKRSTIDNIIGGAEAGLTALTGATTGQLLGAPAGIAGALGDLAGVLTPEEAKSLYERFVSMGTYQPESEAAKDILKSVGSITDTLPPIMGTGPAPRLRDAGLRTRQAKAPEVNMRNIEIPEGRDSVRDAIIGTGGKGAELEQIVEPNQSIIKAREDLGYTEKGTPAMVSENRRYRESEGGMASQIGSELDEQQFKFIQEHEKKADDLLKKHGGIRDANVFDENVRDQVKTTIDDLSKDSDALYQSAFKELDESGKFGAQVNTEPLYRDVEGKALKIGKGDIDAGYKKLTPLEKRIFDETKPQVADLTVSDALAGRKPAEDFSKGSFYNLDRIRKDAGQSIGGISGVFKDEERGQLSKYYSMLSDAQEKAAREVSPEAADKIQKGKQLVVKRKNIEDDAVQMFGNNLDKSFQNRFQSALVSAAGGNPTNLNKLIKTIPENQKQSAILTGLYKAMQGNTRRQGVNPKAASDFWKNLKKQPTVMRQIMSDLSPEAKRDLSKWFKVNEGLSRALESRVVSGRAATSSAFIDNLTSNLSDIAYSSAAAKAGPAGGLIVDSVKGVINEAKNRKANKAIDMLTDESFLNDLGYLVKDETQKRKAATEKRMMRNKKVQNWLDSLSDSELDDIANMGLIGFLSQPKEESAMAGSENMQ